MIKAYSILLCCPVNCKCVCCFLIQFLVASLGLAGCQALACHFDYEFKVLSSDAVRGILFSMASVILAAVACLCVLSHFARCPFFFIFIVACTV